MISRLSRFGLNFERPLQQPLYLHVPLCSSSHCDFTFYSQRLMDFILRVLFKDSETHRYTQLQRINFKLAKLWYLVTSFQQPGYLANLISPYSQPRLLRSSTQKLLSVPPPNLDTAARRFSVAAPRLWNSLPLNCRTAPFVNTFKIRLKTFLFDLV